MNEENLRILRPRKLAASANEARLEQNAPNPFRTFTEIRFAIPRKERVRLLVLDHRKKARYCLFEGQLRAGVYSMLWDGSTTEGEPIAEGRYTYKLEAGHFVAIRKLEIGLASEKTSAN